MNIMDEKIKKAFDHVTAEKELVQTTEDSVIQYMREENGKQSVARHSKKRNIGFALAVALILVFSGLFVYRQPVSAVSINSTSSVEVYFNRFNHVIEVVNYDENGEVDSGEINIQNRHFDEVMNEILNDLDTEEVYITVASHNEEATREMADNLTTHQEMMRNMHIYQSSEEIMNRARESRMPMGRMHAIHELREIENTETSFNIENESTQDLMEIFEEHHREMMGDGHMHNQNGGRMHDRQMRRQR